MSKFWNFTNITPKSGELLLYGPISETSWWDDEVTPKEFAQDLKDLGDIETLTIRINSGGGDVFAATTIYNLIKTHKASKTVIIDGLAASAATIIAMAGDEIQIPANAMMMVHDPMTGAWGNTKVFMKIIELLNKVKDCIISAYMGKTGKSEGELSDLMDQETWMTGAEAVELGFADTLLDAVQVAASVQGDNKLVLNGVSFDMSIYDGGNTVLDKYYNLTKGDEGMTFEEFLASLDEAERALVEDALEAARTEATTEVEATFSEERITLQNTISDLESRIVVPEPGEDDLFNNASPEIKAFIEDMRAREQAANAELQRIKDEKELEQFKNTLSSFEGLPVNVDEYAPIFMQLSRVDAEAVEKVQTLLAAANECITTGKLFDETGTGVPAADATAWDKIQNKVQEMLADNEGLEYAEALQNVLQSNPDLYNEYKKSN